MCVNPTRVLEQVLVRDAVIARRKSTLAPDNQPEKDWIHGITHQAEEGDDDEHKRRLIEIHKVVGERSEAIVLERRNATVQTIV